MQSFAQLAFFKSIISCFLKKKKKKKKGNETADLYK